MSDLETEPAAPPAQDDAVRPFWERLGLPGLVDVHTHFLPDRMMRRVWAHFDEAGPLIGRPWPIRYRWSQAERASYLRRLGVRAFTALTYAHRPGMAAGLSEWALDFSHRTEGCVPGATFFPEPGALEEVERALSRGARVFKLHIQVGGFDPRDPALDGVWALLESTGTPVVLHAGSGPVPRPGVTGPAPVAAVLAAHPGLRLVIAHLGAPEYAGFLDLAERFERVHLDTTMAFTPFFEAMAPFPLRLLDRLAALRDKVVLGSDFPNIPYPYAEQLQALERLGLGDDWLRAVCWSNPARLLGVTDG